MKLGGSLRRRRGGGGSREGKRRGGAGGGGERAGGGAEGARRWGRILLGAAALAVVGWTGGYLLATRVVYPAPPPPTDLVEVPDVRGLGLAGAGRQIEAAGLVLGAVDSVQHPVLGRDLVMGQSPLPGQLAVPGAEVRVTMTLASRGRPLPDVRRVDAGRATQVLETAGFVVLVDSVDSELPRGRVVTSRPAPETPVTVPSEVRLAVSRGPALVVMPYLIGMEEARALAVLDSAGLVVGGVDYVSAPAGEEGRVVGHEPAADTPLERGSAVRLAVARPGG